MNLFEATPKDIRLMMSDITDINVLRSLAKLETAASVGDEPLRIEAIGELFDRLVLEWGMGL